MMKAITSLGKVNRTVVVIKKINPLKISLFSTSDGDGDKPVSTNGNDRGGIKLFQYKNFDFKKGTQAKDAIREYIQKIANKSDANPKNNLWARYYMKKI